MDNSVQKFSGVTIFVLTTNETMLLRTTISEIISSCSDDDIEKIVIVAKNESCAGYKEATLILKETKKTKIELYVQKSKTLELCISELPAMVKSSHFLIMAADMEMRPSDAGKLIERAKWHPERIICAAKWHKDSEVIGYGKLHELGSRTMNKFISILFQKDIHDPFSIFQIFPISAYNQCDFNNPETFAYEYTLKPIKKGFEYEEIPTVYKKRSHGKSNFNLLKLIGTAITFCKIAIYVRFSKF